MYILKKDYAQKLVCAFYKTTVETNKKKLPDILFTKDQPDLDDGMELLGSYNYEKNLIKMYAENIQETAEQFNMYKDITDINKTLENLTNIVLTHEIAHWLIDTTLDSDPKNIKYKEDDEKDFHEGLAQYFTYYIHGEDELFNWLVRNQSKRYNIYKDLLPENKKIKHNYSDDDVNKTFECIRALLKYDPDCDAEKQSWKEIITSYTPNETLYKRVEYLIDSEELGLI